MEASTSKRAPFMYILIRLLFKFVLNVFYGTIVVENEHYIPNDGEPVIICANHTNSLTDALLLVTSVSSKKRSFLRLTAKDTQFGRKTFTSWLIENAGTLPIQRRQEYGSNADNSQTMEKLLKALEDGDAICLFPEGRSWYSPTMAPLKTGVARIVADVLTRNRDKPDFAVTVLTCSLTYVHRQSFRSDVLVSFNPPVRLSVKDTPSLVGTPEKPVDFEAIRSLTTFMHAQLASNTIDAPSWNLIRTAKTAARIYVPLGTRMRLGDWVRVLARFVEGFAIGNVIAGEGVPGISIERKGFLRSVNWGPATPVPPGVKVPTLEKSPERSGDALAQEIVVPVENELAMEAKFNDEEREQLGKDVTAYQDRLNELGLKDDRIRQSENLSRRKIVFRLALRLLLTVVLAVVALPGLLLWVPVFAITTYETARLKKTGPVWDTYDEVAQTKLVYGLITGVIVCNTITTLIVYFGHTNLLLTAVIAPSWMWLTLRWTEDMVSAFRACVALYRMLRVGKVELKKMRMTREDLRSRITTMATSVLGLPADPEPEFLVVKGEEDDEIPSRWAKHQIGRTRGGWDDAARYFSIRRRRKRDWNETLRWFDATDFPKE